MAKKKNDRLKKSDVVRFLIRNDACESWIDQFINFNGNIAQFWKKFVKKDSEPIFFLHGINDEFATIEEDPRDTWNDVCVPVSMRKGLELLRKEIKKYEKENGLSYARIP